MMASVVTAIQQPVSPRCSSSCRFGEVPFRNAIVRSEQPNARLSGRSLRAGRVRLSLPASVRTASTWLRYPPDYDCKDWNWGEMEPLSWADIERMYFTPKPRKPWSWIGDFITSLPPSVMYLVFAAMITLFGCTLAW